MAVVGEPVAEVDGDGSLSLKLEEDVVVGAKLNVGAEVEIIDGGELGGWLDDEGGG